jgi:hypothetical protein
MKYLSKKKDGGNSGGLKRWAQLSRDVVRNVVREFAKISLNEVSELVNNPVKSINTSKTLYDAYMNSSNTQSNVNKIEPSQIFKFNTDNPAIIPKETLDHISSRKQPHLPRQYNSPIDITKKFPEVGTMVYKP